MDSFDARDFNLQKVPSRIVLLLIAIIVMTAVVVPVFMGITGEYIINDDNGPGLGMPMSYEDEDTFEASYTITSNGKTVRIVGAYEGTVNASQDIVLVLTDSSALFVYDGRLTWYDGTGSQDVGSIVLNMSGNQINGIPYQWAYVPDSDGDFRAYSSGVTYDSDDLAVGVGYLRGNTVISVNDRATNTDKVTVTIDRTEDGISNIHYVWREIQ